MTNNYCNKCGKCCSSIAIEKNTQKMYRDGIQTVNDEFLKMLILVSSDDRFDYYTCKYLHNNLCAQPQKPELCLNYPSHPFAFLPDDCGYAGIIFQKLESIKQKIRKLK